MPRFSIASKFAHELIALTKRRSELINKGLDRLKSLQQRSNASAGSLPWQGATRIYTLLDSDNSPGEAKSKLPPDQVHRVAVSVEDYLTRTIADYVAGLGMQYDIRHADTLSKAVVEVDGEPLLTDENGDPVMVPVSMLLDIREYLKTFIEAFEKLPTNDVLQEWQYDDERQLYVASSEPTFVYELVKESMVMYPADEHHPAQTKLVENKTAIGRCHAKLLSGALSVQQHQVWCARLKKVHTAVTQAAQRANVQQVEVRGRYLMAQMFDFVFDEIPSAS
jgi:dGTP triphosphohydrolase